MSLLQAIVLGLVQGLTEFLPVSSSAHLVIVPWLFGWESPGLAFDAALHLGTLTAVLIYFRAELMRMLRAAPRALAHPLRTLRGPGAGRGDDPDARLALLIAIGTIPGAIAGLLGEEFISDLYHAGDTTSSRAIVAIAIALMALAAVLWLAERTARHVRPLAQLRVPDAVAIGLAQALALIPGVSRSGATITAGLFRDLKRADAARFSFLLGIPLIAAAGLKGAFETAQTGMTSGEAAIFIVGIVVSGLSGFAAIWGLLRYLQRASTMAFIVYRFALGLLLLALVAAGFQ
ncbi:MAG: undecaprenyl-diphosphate phosphatase [Thermomicrobiales bacterium]|nr:undecaprenyl-diphosphate phosphatase [Thermomicrobiales bacterium]